MRREYSVNDREIVASVLRLFDNPNVIVKKGKISRNGGASWDKSDWFEVLSGVANNSEVKENENASTKRSSD